MWRKHFSERGLALTRWGNVAGNGCTGVRIPSGNRSATANGLLSGNSARGPRTIAIAGKWAGPCASDQKPGDVIMPDGRKINLTHMQKRAGQLGASPPGTGMPAN